MHAPRIALFPCLLLASCAIPATPAGQEGRVEAWSNRVTNPVSQPTIFEAATIQGEVRPIFIHQRLPKTSLFAGGDFQVYALQLRYPITERLAFIATKDGFIDLNPGSGSVLGGDQEGFADVAGGLKYAVFEDEQFLVTPGLVFETANGQADVFQGNGDGVFRPFVSAAWEPEPKLNVLGNIAANIPSHGGQETQSIDWHLHVDYEATEQLSPLFEVNGIYYSKNSKRVPVGFEGGDLINLGSTMVAGQNVITGAVGARFELTEKLNVGATYGFPLTNRKDLLKDRVTVEFTFTF